MGTEEKNKSEKARELMDDFSRRTGLAGEEGDAGERYLWTDAFAVQTFFGLFHAFEDDTYRERALKLIELVHEKLGRFHPDDEREGWISGLPEEEGRKHPVAGGLRIGKKLPERKENEPFNERLEWERDGQYFHYISRWINALLLAGKETGEHKYALWAAELMQAGGKFINTDGGNLRMYWKMSIDLSRPLVPVMGAHDPLEGLILAESVKRVVPEKAPELELLARKFIQLCSGRDWTTTDSLGIGGLLLNTVRAAELAAAKEEMPESIRPKKLLDESLYGLKGFARIHEKDAPAGRRLAFRECGLSLGLRVLSGRKEQLKASGLNPAEPEKYLSMAKETEDFWLNPERQKASSWTAHKNINAVSLAASVVAESYPAAFLATPNLK